MDCYEVLLDCAHDMGLEVVEKDFKSNVKGLCKGNKIGISKSLKDSKEKRCVLAEEIAHCFFTVGNIIDIRDASNAKQEHYARHQAYEAILPLRLLIDSYMDGNTNCYEIAEDLSVTEDFLTETLYHYAQKHGSCTRRGKYIVCFNPFRVIKKKRGGNYA